MVTLTFPATGKLLAANYNEVLQPMIYRTHMEGGPTKQMRRYADTLIQREVTYRFSAEAYADFKTWFTQEAQHGARWFNWQDPLRSTLQIVRMVEGKLHSTWVPTQPPSWDVSFTLEAYADAVTIPS